MVKQSVLVTGGSGFIGTNLIRKLLSLNYNVNLLTRSSTNLWRIKNVLPKIKIYEASILDKQSLSKTVRKINPNFIIHLATYTQYRNQHDYRQMIETNINGTLNLLEATKDIEYSAFLNTGSSSEYGIKDSPMRETDTLEPISFYAATKASATLLCQVFAREYQKSIVTLRPFSVYGPFEEEKRFIPTIINAIIKTLPIKLTGGSERRDFIFIDDVVDIYINSMKKGKELSGQILNMGTGIEYTNDEVVETLFNATGKKVKIEKGAYPKRLWDTPHWVADIQKVQEALIWKPRFSLKEGLKKTYEWYNMLEQ
ncbi:MAG: SDR family NAD(P)-dependent oxidoreductase [Candidatus Levybacteria bacterium]|nr:SDR family NAD(P)-dependent oxidoreductase [Candidatus Levybacteria bacterium]